jgi:hypothetical protein
LKAVRDMSQGELAAYVDTRLKEKGVEVVLSGGASVAIYSNHMYVSKDIDFVDRYFMDHEAVREVMIELGFERVGKHYHHSDTDYYIDFVSGPPSIGREPISEIVELSLGTGTVRVITATDCVRDRLAAFFYFDDRQALEQAILVAQANEVDLEVIAKWAQDEAEVEKYEEFARRLR